MPSWQHGAGCFYPKSSSSPTHPEDIAALLHCKISHLHTGKRGQFKSPILTCLSRTGQSPVPVSSQQLLELLLQVSTYRRDLEAYIPKKQYVTDRDNSHGLHPFSEYLAGTDQVTNATAPPNGPLTDSLLIEEQKGPTAQTDCVYQGCFRHGFSFCWF